MPRRKSYSTPRKTYKRRSTSYGKRTTSSRRGGGAQTIKLVLQHQMMPAAPQPLITNNGQGMSLVPPTKGKQSKL